MYCQDLPNKEGLQLIGVQSYGLSEALLRHPEETFIKLSEIGYDFLEPMLVLQEQQGDAPLSYAPYKRFERLWALSKTYPLRIENVHVSPHVDGKMHGKVLPPQFFADSLIGLYQKFSIKEFIVSSKFFDEESAIFWGKYLCDIAKRLSHTPCRLLYHNHDSEMYPVRIGNSTVPLLDLFVDASQGNILLELDIGWAGMVADEVDIARRYAEYIYILHFKDFVHGSRGHVTCDTSTAECYAPSGTGEIRTAEVLHLRDSFINFCGKGIIEQNESTHDIFTDLKTGYQVIKSLLE